VTDRSGIETLADADHDLSPEACADLARAAAALVELDGLDRRGAGSATLLWRNERSEGWLNTWWELRDTGFHDHGGSCVGVFVLEGRARSEALVVGARRRVAEYGAGESFRLAGSGIHRVEHARGTVTIHVYAPPLREIGHYEVVEGELRRDARPADEVTPPSPALASALDSAS
jgi:Cysteine dioxygenase type I